VGLIERERANRLQTRIGKRGGNHDPFDRSFGAARACDHHAHPTNLCSERAGRRHCGRSSRCAHRRRCGGRNGAIAGGIIGGVVGASIAAQAERRNNYYWYNGRCYAAVQGGYVLVKRAYCY
jgi:hypothetical protein